LHSKRAAPQRAALFLLRSIPALGKKPVQKTRRCFDTFPDIMPLVGVLGICWIPACGLEGIDHIPRIADRDVLVHSAMERPYGYGNSPRGKRRVASPGNRYSSGKHLRPLTDKIP